MEIIEETPINKDEFKFYVPLDIEKAEDDTDDIESKYKKWILGGVASTGKKDTQGETLSPENYDLSSFLWVNFEHLSSNPEYIIGEIIKSEVDENKLYIQTQLFPENKHAQSVWELAKNLKKSKNGNSLAYSVEGSVVERDPSNPKKITKAKLTGVAICKTPVNGETFADLIEKGYTEQNPDKNYVTLGGKSYEAYLDDEGNPQIRELEKTMTTAETQPVQKESVEGKVQNENPYNKKMKKSEVYSKIFSQYSGINTQQAKRVFELVNKIEKSKSNINMAQEENKFSEEALNKAFEILDLADKGQGDNVEKAKKAKKAEDEEYEEENKKEQKDDEEEEEEVDKGKGVKKAKLSTQEEIDAEIKRLQEVKDQMMQDQQGDVTEYNTSNQMTKAVKDELVNDISQKTNEQLEKALSDLSENFQSRFQALGTLLKSERERREENEQKLEKAYDTIQKLGERLNIVEKTPQERKSVTDVGYKERFSKGEDANNGRKQLSVSQNRQDILKALEDRSGLFKGEPGRDLDNKEKMYSSAITEFESQGTLNKSVIEDLQAEGIQITK